MKKTLFLFMISLSCIAQDKMAGAKRIAIFIGNDTLTYQYKWLPVSANSGTSTQMVYDCKNMARIEPTTQASTFTILLPSPTDLTKIDRTFVVMFKDIINTVVFSQNIYHRENGKLYYSTTFVPDNRDYSTLNTLKEGETLFKTRKWGCIVIFVSEGKYFYNIISN